MTQKQIEKELLDHERKIKYLLHSVSEGGGSGGGGNLLIESVGADFTLASSNLLHTNWVNVKDYGAVGNGVTNDTTAFSSAIATGSNVFVPAGNFLISGSSNTTALVLSAGQRLFGVGHKSIVRTTSNIRIVQLLSNCVVDGIRFIGNCTKTTGTNTLQSACTVSTGALAWQISNCYIENFGGTTSSPGGGGIRISSLGGSNTEGARITNCNFRDSLYGLHAIERGEYVEIIGCKFTNCGTGAVCAAGNLVFSACNFQSCTTGMSLITGANNGHGIISGCQLNHNTTNLSINAIASQGMTFSGVHFYAGNINITDSTGINFVACDFVQGTITLTNNTLLSRTACRVPISPVSNAMTVNVVSGSNFTETANLNF